MSRIGYRFAAVLGFTLLLFAGTVWSQEASRRVKTKVDPSYPELAKSMHLSGTVKVEVKIAPDGTVRATKVLGGHPVLVQSVLDALRKWKYEAAGEETTLIIPFRFNE